MQLQESNDGRCMDKEHFQTEAFFAALDGVRVSREKTWKDVAAESGVSASTLTRMAQGRRPDVDGLAALLKWSGLKADGYLKGVSARANARQQPDTLAVVSTLLRADKKLTKESVAALDEIFRAAYKRMVDLD